MKPLVIYHDKCTDGFAAAFAAWLKLGNEAEYVPMQYGTPLDPSKVQYEDRDVYVLDFSFPREAMDRLFAHAKRVVWLDHHKTAFEMWCDGIPEKGWYESGDSLLEFENFWIQLDNDKSGALLAWEYFHPDTEVPMLIRHIDDRDRWQWKLEGSAEIHAALGSMKPWSFEQWKYYIEDEFPDSDDVTVDALITEGCAILRAQKQHVERMAKQARTCTIDLRKRAGDPEIFTGLAVNASIHQSEIGSELANKSGTYGLVWYVAENGRVRCSLRSNGEYDVSVIAKAFGGGGHKNASGFEIDIETLTGWMK